MNFSVKGKELEDAEKWMLEQKKEHPGGVTTIGGRFSYQFTPTGLGVSVSVHDNWTGDYKDVTDVDSW